MTQDELFRSKAVKAIKIESDEARAHDSQFMMMPKSSLGHYKTNRVEDKIREETTAYQSILRQIEQEHQARLDSLMITMSQADKLRLSKKYKKIMTNKVSI